MAAPPNHVFSAFAFVGFAMCAVPFYWHLEAWNTGTCLYMAWTGISCLIQFINSIVWDHNAINWAPVWCDISTRIMVGAAVGIPASSLCINRRLYKIASIKAVTVTKSEKRHGIMIDLAIGVGIPVLQMILQYVVQGHRFDIFEDVGCFPFTWNTPLAYVLVFTWPVVIGLVSIFYCSLSIRTFWKRRRQFNEVLAGNRNLSFSRYFRLMALAGIELCCTIPLGSYSIYLNVTGGVISKWVSWDDTHFDFSRVGQFPNVLWRTDHVEEVSIELSRWLVVLCAFIFFGFFGFADEARKHYRLVYTSARAARLGYTTATMSSFETSSYNASRFADVTSSNKGNIAIFMSTERSRRRDSLLSFSDRLSTSISIGDDSDDLDEKKPYSPTESTASSSRDAIDHEAGHKSLPQLPEIARPQPSLDVSTVP
ncbi:hypothetical protein EWM64_g10493, partial [Hericium alpestre]